MGLHSDTEIYRTVEALGDLALRAAASMRRDVKPLLGGRLVDATVAMALLVRGANIARDAAKVEPLNALLEEVEVTQFLLRRAFANRYIAPAMMAASIPLTESVARQATALRNTFAAAP